MGTRALRLRSEFDFAFQVAVRHAQDAAHVVVAAPKMHIYVLSSKKLRTQRSMLLAIVLRMQNRRTRWCHPRSFASDASGDSHVSAIA